MASSDSSAGEYDADPLPPKVTATNSRCSLPLAGKNYEEGECCGDSGDLIRAEEVGFKRGESTSSNSGGQDESASDSNKAYEELLLACIGNDIQQTCTSILSH